MYAVFLGAVKKYKKILKTLVSLYTYLQLSGENHYYKPLLHHKLNQPKRTRQSAMKLRDKHLFPISVILLLRGHPEIIY